MGFQEAFVKDFNIGACWAVRMVYSRSGPILYEHKNICLYKGIVLVYPDVHHKCLMLAFLQSEAEGVRGSDGGRRKHVLLASCARRDTW